MVGTLGFHSCRDSAADADLDALLESPDEIDLDDSDEVVF